MTEKNILDSVNQDGLCAECNFVGKNCKALKVHKKMSHRHVQHNCNQCHYRGAHLSYLKQHIKSKHGNEEFMCDSCEYMASKKDNVMHHSIRKHDATKKSCKNRKLIGLATVVAGSRKNSSPVFFLDIKSVIKLTGKLCNLFCFCGGSNGTSLSKKTNRETIMWYKDVLLNGKISQENMKYEAIKFFGDSMKGNSKNIIARNLEEFRKEHFNFKLKVQREIQRNYNGHGKHFDNPPDSFTPNLKEIAGIVEQANGHFSCELCAKSFNDMTEHMQLQLHAKEKKKAFTQLCRNEVNNHKDYINWLDGNVDIPGVLETEEDAMNKKIDEFQRQKKRILKDTIDHGHETFRITSQESNIINAERTIVTENADGTLKKTVLKEQLAKITVRKRSISGENTENIEPGPSGEGKRKKSKTMNSVMNHLTANNSNDKAEMLAHIIDMNEIENPGFGNKIVKKSKVLPNQFSLNAQQTTSLVTGTRASDLVFDQIRTVFNSTIGFSPIASRKKVEKHREKIMVVKKADWKNEVKTLYQNKQGKNKHIPKETTVWSVKDLLAYIPKLAESEDLDFSNGILPVCFDGDAGGGRFVATFAFMNRHDKDVKLHPFLLFERFRHKEKHGVDFW